MAEGLLSTPSVRHASVDPGAELRVHQRKPKWSKESPHCKSNKATEYNYPYYCPLLVSLYCLLLRLLVVDHIVLTSDPRATTTCMHHHDVPLPPDSLRADNSPSLPVTQNSQQKQTLSQPETRCPFPVTVFVASYPIISPLTLNLFLLFISSQQSII